MKIKIIILIILQALSVACGEKDSEEFVSLKDERCTEMFQNSRWTTEDLKNKYSIQFLIIKELEKPVLKGAYSKK